MIANGESYTTTGKIMIANGESYTTTVTTEPCITAVACGNTNYEIVDKKARQDIEQIKKYLGLVNNNHHDNDNNINAHNIYYKTNIEYIY